MIARVAALAKAYNKVRKIKKSDMGRLITNLLAKGQYLVRSDR